METIVAFPSSQIKRRTPTALPRPHLPRSTSRSSPLRAVRLGTDALHPWNTPRSTTSFHSPVLPDPSAACREQEEEEGLRAWPGAPGNSTGSSPLRKHEGLATCGLDGRQNHAAFSLPQQNQCQALHSPAQKRCQRGSAVPPSLPTPPSPLHRLHRSV